VAVICIRNQQTRLRRMDLLFPNGRHSVEKSFAGIVNGDSVLIRADSLEDFLVHLSVAKLLVGLTASQFTSPTHLAYRA